MSDPNSQTPLGSFDTYDDVHWATLALEVRVQTEPGPFSLESQMHCVLAYLCSCSTVWVFSPHIKVSPLIHGALIVRPLVDVGAKDGTEMHMAVFPTNTCEYDTT